MGALDAAMVSREIIEKIGCSRELLSFTMRWDWSARIPESRLQYLLQAKGLIYHKGVHYMASKKRHKGVLSTPEPDPVHAQEYQFWTICVFNKFFYLFSAPKPSLRIYLKDNFSI